MVTTIRRIPLFALATGAFLVIAGCRKPAATTNDASDGAPPATKLRVQLNWVAEPEFGGLYAARENGAYAREGLEVELKGGGAGSPVVQLVASGQADFGIAGADDVVTARVRGADVVAIFATFQVSPQGVMVHEEQNVASLADLKSGILALELGLPFGMYLRKKLGFHGVSIVPYDGGVAKFLTDATYAQQCYVTSEPIAVKKRGVRAKVFLGAESGFNPYASMIITRGAMLRDKRDAVRAFVRASADGWKAYLRDPKPANAVMQKLNGAMDAETFAAAAEAQKPLIETDASKAQGLGAMDEARFATLASQLVDLGVIAKAPIASECFTTVLP